MEPGEGGRDTGHPVLLVYSYACTHKKDCQFCMTESQIARKGGSGSGKGGSVEN